MSFPTATTEIKDTGREAIKRDFNDLDSLIGELSVPKEQINRTVPGAAPGSAGHSEFILESQEMNEGDPIEKMSPEVAAISGKAITETIDTVLATGFSLYAKSPSPEKYEATRAQKERLSAAWAAVSSKCNYRVEDSPWLHIIALNAGIYIPKFNEAKNDRRFAEVQEQLLAEKAAREALQKRVEDIEAQSKPAA